MQGQVLLWIVTILYGGQCALNLWNGQTYQAMIIGGYTFANVGLILLASKGG